MTTTTNNNSITSIKAELADLTASARAYRNTHNEGGYGYNPYDAKIEDACRRLREAELADYVARWPQIRAAWNAALAKYTNKDGNIDMRNLHKIEAEAGITLGDMQAVKAMAGA